VWAINKITKNTDIHKILQTGENGVTTKVRVFPDVPLYCKVDIKGKLEALNAMFKYQTAGDLTVYASNRDKLPDENHFSVIKRKPNLVSFEVKEGVSEEWIYLGLKSVTGIVAEIKTFFGDSKNVA
jgi:hypothetical protein